MSIPQPIINLLKQSKADPNTISFIDGVSEPVIVEAQRLGLVTYDYEDIPVSAGRSFIRKRHVELTEDGEAILREIE